MATADEMVWAQVKQQVRKCSHAGRKGTVLQLQTKTALPTMNPQRLKAIIGDVHRVIDE